eukprot:jgi/Chlat1/1363/Chrsp119S01781
MGRVAVQSVSVLPEIVALGSSSSSNGRATARSAGATVSKSAAHLPSRVTTRFQHAVSTSSSFLGDVLRLPGSKRMVVATCGGRRAVVCTLERPWKKHDARLVLEDGSVWTGVAFGAKGTVVAEVVFNTALTGYQEILTDPSYSGQFVTMTCPHIGNTGINPDDFESQRCFLGGLIVRSLSPVVSNYRSTQTLSDFLEAQNVLGISELDTRALTKKLRETGALMGVISTDSALTDDQLTEKAKSWSIVGEDLITPASSQKPYEWTESTDDEWEFSPHATDDRRLHVVAYDFGIKRNIMRRLVANGCRVTVVPSTTSPEEVLAMNPDGIMFSNGPGDPSAVPYAVENIKQLLGKVPVFGICMGHQLLGQAFGGKTFKLKFGHHGGNHPIRHIPTGRIEISSQNHNYAVDPETLPEGVDVTHVNLNDGTCAGMVYPAMKAMSIQYHPEASPGPHDADLAFADFVTMVKAEKEAKSTAQQPEKTPAAV